MDLCHLLIALALLVLFYILGWIPGQRGPWAKDYPADFFPPGFPRASTNYEQNARLLSGCLKVIIFFAIYFVLTSLVC
jgi:hypothetical protein